jgi:L-malate glycosyltransferase
MKVLVITNLGMGSSVTLPERKLFQGLKSKGVEITVLTQPPFDLADKELNGIKVVTQAISKKLDLEAIRRIRNLLKNEEFDILHCMYGKAITNGLIASRGLNVKTVGYLGSLSCYWHDPFSWMTFLNPGLDKLICVSDGVKNHVLKQIQAGSADKVVRIYKGSDPEWFKDVIPVNRNELGIPGDAFVVCCVANIRKTKGVKWLINAANYLPENLPIRFLLVGHKTNSPAIRKMISKTKYPVNFITTGHSQIPASYMSICDLYIQPSICEGFPKTVVEAMCLGKPVVVTDRGGAKELVKEGVTGYVVSPGSPQAIAEILVKCFKNRDLLPEMGRKGMERIRNEFNHLVTVEETYKLYLELTAEKN